MDAEIDLHTVLGFLRRQLLLIFMVFVAVMGVATVVILSLTPVYTATTLVMVDPADTSLLAPLERSPSTPSDARVESEVLLARSENVLLSVIDRENLSGSEEFRAKASWLDQLLTTLRLRETKPPGPDLLRWQALGALSAMTKVERHRGTHLMSIAVSSQDPERAAVLANAVAHAHIETQLAAEVQGVLNAAAVLRQQIEALREDASDAGPLNQHYEQLLARSQQLEAEASLQLADSRVVSPALVPGAAAHPRTGALLAIGALVALGIALLVAYLHEHYIGAIASQEQLATIAKSKLVIVVPKAKAPAGHKSLADLLVSAPISAYSEAIRRIRSSVDHRLDANGFDHRSKAPVILVTSASAAEGKATTALSLARAYALAGRRALLIDCDLRQPSVHTHLDLMPDQGLIEVLAADDPAERLGAILVRDDDTGLMVLVGSRGSTQATDQLITGHNFERLLNASVRAFDIVVLKAPPLGPVVDGLYIAQRADAIVFLVQAATTGRREVGTALAALSDAIGRSDILVPVLNCQDEPMSGSNRRQRKYLEQRSPRS